MKKHRALSLLLAAALTLGAGSTAAVYAEESGTEQVVFTDISKHWAENTIKEAVSLGIAGGYPDNTFLPDNLIKREEFYSMVCNILTEKPDTTGTIITFTDVDPNGWYLSTVQMAVAGSMTSGYPDGTFGIGIMMSRQEAAQVASKVIPADTSSSDTTAKISDLNDADAIADWSYNAIELMFKKGYMKGDTEGNFRPTTGITRAEAVHFLLLIYKNEPEIKAAGSSSSSNSSSEATASKEPERSLGGCVTSHLARTVANVADLSDAEYEALPDGHFKVGDGTAASPYEVYSQAQLDHIREHNEAGAYFKLMSNIEVTQDYSGKKPADTSTNADWTSGNWKPIGSKDAPFKGMIDGNGYIISGLNVKNSSTQKTDAAGFIGNLAPEGKLSYLHISKSNFSNAGNYTAAVAGYTEGVITGCIASNSVEVNGANYVGGIAGSSSNTISDCANNGDVNGTGRYLGGIVGQFQSKGSLISGCQNKGVVTGTDSAGGIAGYVTGEALTSGAVIIDCVNQGTVTGGAYYTGGIVAWAHGVNYGFVIQACDNQGEVNGSSVTGGIVGFAESNKISIIDCDNTGDVFGYSAGGIVGSNEGSIELSKNEGRVDGSIYIGGIVGFQRTDKAKITKCYNEGTIGNSSATNVGGIAGESAALVSYTYNSGGVLASGLAGGIVGKNGGRIVNGYNAGDIRDASETGGIAGRNTGTLNNCFWLADASATAVSSSSNTGALTRVYSVTEEQLAGDKTIRTDKGSEEMLAALNEHNSTDSGSVWEFASGGYDYPVLADMQ